ncbi:MAG: hypothetical protein FJY77_04060 [Candidatus Altiarchaeales archaeon]|nr:hypothetical protein [Candidatus Altiarchaeales archaeon]
MQVVNKTRNIVLSRNAGIANTLFGRMRGLMFSGRKDLVLDCGFDDATAAAIHMLFMRFPIDVIWADSKMNVVDLQENVQPFNPLKPSTWRIYKPEKPARYVIELGFPLFGSRFSVPSFQFPEVFSSRKPKTENRKPRTEDWRPNRLGTTEIGDKIEFKQNG